MPTTRRKLPVVASPPQDEPADVLAVPDKAEIRAVAIVTLMAVARNTAAAPAARAAASRTLLESLGDIGRLQEVARANEKPLSEMNARELDDEIARLQPKRGKRERT